MVWGGGEHREHLPGGKGSSQGQQIPPASTKRDLEIPVTGRRSTTSGGAGIKADSRPPPASKMTASANYYLPKCQGNAQQGGTSVLARASKAGH